jgi:fatty-acyl-CoA synthase
VTVNFDPKKTLGQLLAERADGATTTALAFGDEVYTYQDLYESALAMARAWHERGIKARDIIAVWLPNCVEWVIAGMACALLGAVLEPVNVRLKPREVAFLVTRSQPRLIVMTSTFMTYDFERIAAEAFPGIWTPGDRGPEWPLPGLAGIVCTGDRGLPNSWSWQDLLKHGRCSVGYQARIPADVDITDPMLILWTSGTTSEPKGVVLDHQGLVGIGHWYQRLGFTPEERVVASMPLYYIAGYYYGLLGPLLAGAMSILGQALTAEESLGSIDRRGGTMLVGGPSSYLALAAHPQRTRFDLSSVRRGYVGGAALTPEQVRIIREDLGVRGLVQVYGMTETHGVSTSTAPGVSDDELALTVGTPLPGVETKVVDPVTRAEVASGEPGEMLIRGRTMTSYLGFSQPDEERYWDHGWFRTGDLMSTDQSGRSRYRGRLKDVIKSGGENVAAVEVEALIRSNPNVEEVAVVAVPDKHKGEVVGAAVQFRDATPDAVAELLQWLRPQLATFKIPKHVLLVPVASDWPRNVSYKIIKSDVREQMIETLGLH